MRIRDRKKFGSGIEKNRIRDKNPGSATLQGVNKKSLFSVSTVYQKTEETFLCELPFVFRDFQVDDKFDSDLI